MSLADPIFAPTGLSASRAHAPLIAHDGHRRLVRAWLVTLIVLVFVMVVVGGATRLTGSGLSITEWRPVTGAIPPLNHADWLSEFEKYRQIPQYQLLNKGMSLAEFQFIYWWEWGHRQLGRFIGMLMLGGFLFVALRRMVSVKLGAVIFGMGLLLALQGVVGWIMVASGLQPGMVAVAPIKLTLHLTFACLFFGSLVALARLLQPGLYSSRGAAGVGGEMSRAVGREVHREDHPHPRPFPAAGKGETREAVETHRLGASLTWPVLLLVLTFAQIALGGLVAGSRAGWTFNTWPLMDGALVPSAATLFAGTPWWENFVDNPALVQFNHRIGAYVLLGLAIWQAVRLRPAWLPCSPPR
jgi:cytochrome c oxidase assembly protein subunit 15